MELGDPGQVAIAEVAQEGAADLASLGTQLLGSEEVGLYQLVEVGFVDRVEIRLIGAEPGNQARIDLLQIAPVAAQPPSQGRPTQDRPVLLGGDALLTDALVWQRAFGMQSSQRVTRGAELPTRCHQELFGGRAAGGGLAQGGDARGVGARLCSREGRARERGKQRHAEPPSGTGLAAGSY